MRYLLLSVLVVCAIGVMVPSVFAETQDQTVLPLNIELFNFSIIEITEKQATLEIEFKVSNPNYKSFILQYIKYSIHHNDVRIEAGEIGGIQENLASPNYFIILNERPLIVGEKIIIENSGNTPELWEALNNWKNTGVQPYSVFAKVIESGEHISSITGTIEEDPWLHVLDDIEKEQDPMHQMAALSESLGIAVEPTGNLDKLIPGEYNSYDEVYIAYEYPISEEVPAIEIYTAFTSQAGVDAGVTFYKHSSNDIAKQFGNELAMSLGLYGDVNLTSDSSCKVGTFFEFNALICSKNDVVVYVIGTENIYKLTKGILGNIKSSSISIEPLYIIIGVVAIGGIIGAIAVAKRGSKTPKPAAKPKSAKQKPAKKKETSAFCENCGNSLKPTAKFCGKCGTARS